MDFECTSIIPLTVGIHGIRNKNCPELKPISRTEVQLHSGLEMASELMNFTLKDQLLLGDNVVNIIHEESKNNANLKTPWLSRFQSMAESKVWARLRPHHPDKLVFESRLSHQGKSQYLCTIELDKPILQVCARSNTSLLALTNYSLTAFDTLHQKVLVQADLDFKGDRAIAMATDPASISDYNFFDIHRPTAAQLNTTNPLQIDQDLNNYYNANINSNTIAKLSPDLQKSLDLLKLQPIQPFPSGNEYFVNSNQSDRASAFGPSSLLQNGHQKCSNAAVLFDHGLKLIDPELRILRHWDLLFSILQWGPSADHLMASDGKGVSFIDCKAPSSSPSLTTASFKHSVHSDQLSRILALSNLTEYRHFVTCHSLANSGALDQILHLYDLRYLQRPLLKVHQDLLGIQKPMDAVHWIDDSLFIVCHDEILKIDGLLNAIPTVTFHSNPLKSPCTGLSSHFYTDQLGSVTPLYLPTTSHTFNTKIQLDLEDQSPIPAVINSRDLFITNSPSSLPIQSFPNPPSILSNTLSQLWPHPN